MIYTQLKRYKSGRVNRFAVLAYFKVQLSAVGIAVTHAGDGLAAFNGLAFAYRQALVVAVSSQEGAVVLDDHQIAVAAQAGTGIHHFTVGGRYYRLAGGTCNVHAFAGGAELGDHITGGRALPSNTGYGTRTAGSYAGSRRRSAAGSRL